ncbi:MAG: hypothetical protein ACE5IY_09230 [bacterium]
MLNDRVFKFFDLIAVTDHLALPGNFQGIEEPNPIGISRNSLGSSVSRKQEYAPPQP